MKDPNNIYFIREAITSHDKTIKLDSFRNRAISMLEII